MGIFIISIRLYIWKHWLYPAVAAFPILLPYPVVALSQISLSTQLIFPGKKTG
jgi:hypothetical protein